MNMQRRDFTKSTLKAASALALGGAFSTSCALPETPKPKLPSNWMWMRPGVDQTIDYWKATFDRIKSMGIDAILPQVYNSYHARFDHPLLPVKDNWLETIIPLAHAAGLEVHAWMWSMILNVPEMIDKHPDWFSVSRNGKPAHTDPAYVNYYKFMCPCHPEVREFVAGNVTALAKIEDLDGIHLDYIRQPDVILAEALQPKYDLVQDKEYGDFDYPYSELCRIKFKDLTGIDPFDLGDNAPQHKDWRQFRYDQVTELVNDYAVLAAKKYNKKITAAVFPNWESVRQQWHNWELDGFLPMLYHGFYNEDINWIGEQIKKNKALLKADQRIYSGLYLPHMKPTELKEAHHVAKTNGANGIALFSYGDFKSPFEEELRKILLR